MNLDNIVHGTVGIIHLVVALLAMIVGMFVLVTKKGTPRHRKLGYVYSVTMTIMLITAFMLYNLYGKFAMFHWMAVISTLTLFLGLYPIIRKKGKDYVYQHFGFMYWSVIGLYAAFMAETFVRLPNIILTPEGKPNVVFYKMIGISIALTMAVGIFFFIKNKNRWKEEFSR